MSRIAFIGLGTMGQGMVANLLAAGHDVTVYNRTRERTRAAADAGASVADSATEAVADADFVMYCLADDAAVREVVLGDEGIVAAVPGEAIVIDLSTIDPETGLAEHQAYGERGVAFLDAPVFGSKPEAADGGLWVVVGGDAEVFEKARVVLEPISATLHHMGEAGDGHRMKLVGNLLVASQLQGLGEALALASAAGLDLNSVLDVVGVTDFRTPIYDGVGESVVAGDYAPSFALSLMRKDANLITAFADRLGVEVPATKVVGETIERAMDAGYGDENASALIKVIAADAGTNLAGS